MKTQQLLTLSAHELGMLESALQWDTNFEARNLAYKLFDLRQLIANRGSIAVITVPAKGN